MLGLDNTFPGRMSWPVATVCVCIRGWNRGRGVTDSVYEPVSVCALEGRGGCVRTVRSKTLDTLPRKYQHTVGEAGDHVLSER